MKTLIHLLLHHWLAKLVSLVLAVVLWGVIKKSIQTTVAPSKIRGFQEKSLPL